MGTKKWRKGLRLNLIAGAVVSLLGFASGCAVSRGILEVEVPTAMNPSIGPAYKIVEVKDSRQFQLRPQEPSIPSLKGGEIDNESITSRAIARKRNGYGKAMGDILLPEGQTVTELTARAVARAMRESGLRVVEQGDPDWKRARPVEAEIQQHWT